MISLLLGLSASVCQRLSESPGGLINTQIAAPRVSDALGLVESEN